MTDHVGNSRKLADGRQTSGECPAARYQIRVLRHVITFGEPEAAEDLRLLNQWPFWDHRSSAKLEDRQVVESDSSPLGRLLAASRVSVEAACSVAENPGQKNPPLPVPQAVPVALQVEVSQA